MSLNIERLGKVIDKKVQNSGNKVLLPESFMDSGLIKKPPTIKEHIKLFKGIAEGIMDYNKEGFDSNTDIGQRSSEAQKGMDYYKEFKMAGDRELKAGRITEKQFNFIKGKAGSKAFVNYYIDNNVFPRANKNATHFVNFVYQLNQTLNSGQSWGDGIDDLIEQGKGVENNTKLESPYKEIQKLKIERVK